MREKGYKNLPIQDAIYCTFSHKETAEKLSLPLKERELKGIIELKSLLFPFKKGRN